MLEKREFEFLRGEPIAEFSGNPMDIPCIETSDPGRLCIHPVVSVNMITYNHEPYIRKAIEGVMMQKTDFEFELVIGEDCSTDKTREICFEYQKLYPDKIRVLWWHENLRKVNHPAGCNGARTTAHCRGEFIAYCEGDDYWTDPLKLQKQVDVMRAHDDVGLCVTGALICNAETGSTRAWNADGRMHYGLLTGHEFIATYLFGSQYSDCSKGAPDERLIITASSMVRVNLLEKVVADGSLYKWGLRLGDVQKWVGLARCSNVYIMPDQTAIYNLNPSSVSNREPHELIIDGTLVRGYLMMRHYNRSISSMPGYYRDKILFHFIPSKIWKWSYLKQIGFLLSALRMPTARAIVYSFRTWWMPLMIILGMGSPRFARLHYGLYGRLHSGFGFPKWLKEEQDKYKGK